MNSSAPLWLTVFLAAITSITAVTAAVMTTWLNARHSTRRLRLEIDHQQDQENRKLLFEHRLELYTAIAKWASGLMKNVEGAKVLGDEDSDKSTEEKKRATQAFRDSTAEFNSYINELHLLGSMTVLACYMKFTDFYVRTLSSMINLIEDPDLSDLEEDHRKLYNSRVQLLAHMKKDLDVGISRETKQPAVR
ncbi:hypothetical protein [Amycolatopsis sp. WAC 04182]|uniref:hypothetical protein n=1 Tax=Amycolatopsis sp. WAC 04182 TaxID=2203198 RepID=UPI000F76DD96|nr:hypothetical protein [Amycolatopsis sp. WAC 04182]